jgi:hypothetical protein
MHSVLFVLEKVDEHNNAAKSAYNEAKNAIDKSTEKNESVESLSVNVWLLYVPRGVPVLGLAIGTAEGLHLKYRLLFLKKDRWIHSDRPQPDVS